MNATNGMGRFYSYPSGGANRVLLRGRGGTDEDYAGIYATYLLWGSAESAHYIGFRCAFR